MTKPVEELRAAFRSGDAARVRELFQLHPEFRAGINEPSCEFDSPPVTRVRSREMLDALLEAGADINSRSRWWAGGFGLLDCADPALAAYAIERGATLDAHSAARLGLLGDLERLIAKNPALVHARGGDGQTPLHFASTVPIAEFLLDHGAEMDARDIDHESTPAQYMIRDRQEIARLLVHRGCQTDIFMPAALGDLALARRHLDAHPDSIRARVNNQSFPMRTPRAGGTIYNWSLGWHVAPHDVAKNFGHDDVFQLLMDRSSADVKLLVFCWRGDEPAVRALLAENPSAAAQLRTNSPSDVANAARNNNTDAVRLMLAAGLPVDARGQHGGTPLHWAAWHGNAAMARIILAHSPPLESIDADFSAPPLGWAMHGSENGWHRGQGDYPAVVHALLDAGAKAPKQIEGTPAVQSALIRG
jgi:ankyrin repeat protein